MAKGKSGIGGNSFSKQAKVSFFNKHYDLSKLSDSDIDKLAQGLINDDVLLDNNIIAIRSVEPEYAADLNPSKVWEDNVMTDEELDGVSALNLHNDNYDFDDADSLSSDIKSVLSQAQKTYSLPGYKPFLIVGNIGSGGEDIGEIVVSDPQIIDLMKYL